ncbi:sigma-70 family RNA polymerase sigma factor, partial [Streptomyces capillispiralis]
MRPRAAAHATPTPREDPADTTPAPPPPGPPAGPPPAHDPQTFIRAVYDKHGTALLRIATGLLGGDTHRAEDIVQEAVLRAWRRADILDAQADGIRAWLVTVVRHLVIDAHRARQARPPETSDTDTPEIPGGEHDEHTLNTSLVLQALQDLTPSHREILLHIHYLDRSVADTAHQLGIPQGTVK